MKVSLSEIRRIGYENVVARPVSEIVELIGAQLGAVEGVEDLRSLYQDVVVAHIREVRKHPDADRLQVCMIDDGGYDTVVERDESGYIQVVCGAPNVRVGMQVAWLPPGAIVPETYHTEAPFRLEARPLRGVVSQGMLASAKELALGDNHEGILEVDEEAAAGTPFAAVYHLDDTVVEIENKMFTHRPDCFGLLGVARELAGIQKQQFESPAWYTDEPEFVAGDGLSLTVDNQATDKVPRLMAVALTDVAVGPSPLWLQTALVRMGARPINNVVDVTNYVMLLTGQPLHAYDYDKVGGTVASRMAVEGEEVRLLNGKTVALNTADIVITDGTHPIGLGGVMGGAETEVTDETCRVILEVATFDMYAIRRTSMRHGLFTDAVTRFNKGQSPLQNDRILSFAVGLLKEVAGASRASQVMDHGADMRPRKPVITTRQFVNSRLGLDLSAQEMAALLENVEFIVDVTKDTLKVHVPFWRTDIDIAEDVVEEIGRLHGYDNVPLQLPKRVIQPVTRNPVVAMKQRVREILSAAGANEVFSYSFVHEKMLTRALQDKSDAYRLSNALSPDLQYYRLSVLPSVLDKVRPNLKRGYEHLALFEIGKYHSLSAGTDEEGLPREFMAVDMVYAAKRPTNRGAPYYVAQRYVRHLAEALHLSVAFAPFDEVAAVVPSEPFVPSRSALIMIGDVCLGTVGELRQEVRDGFKLPDTVSAFSMDMSTLVELASGASYAYSPLPRFPGTERDVTFRTEENTPYAHFEDLMRELSAHVGPEIDWQVAGRYKAAATETHIHLTLRIAIRNTETTITAEEANQVVERLAEMAQTRLGATLV